MFIMISGNFLILWNPSQVKNLPLSILLWSFRTWMGKRAWWCHMESCVWAYQGFLHLPMKKNPHLPGLDAKKKRKEKTHRGVGSGDNGSQESRGSPDFRYGWTRATHGPSKLPLPPLLPWISLFFKRRSQRCLPTTLGGCFPPGPNLAEKKNFFLPSHWINILSIVHRTVLTKKPICGPVTWQAIMWAHLVLLTPGLGVESASPCVREQIDEPIRGLCTRQSKKKQTLAARI